MDIPAKYDPTGTEDKWYQYWIKQGFFRSVPDEREPYTIVIPPPNVTGVLHMGHMLNNTIQDVLMRRARMIGKNALWVPGTDHASIATEAKVVAKLKNEGIDKNTLSREQFLKHAWEWKEKHGGIILEQLKKLGASCDWDRTRFTMDEGYYESVIDVFIDFYDKGLIYRGVRMINWDPQAKTAVSDEEVIYKEVSSKLYHVKYHITGENDFITIATTRPETILGDTAVCINPKDKRYRHLKGKTVVVPMVNREVPVIEDEYVDMEFGTGCLKITPAHDINDYEIGIRHNLQSIDIFNDDGTLNEKAEVFTGEDRFAARELAVEKLRKEGLLIKEESYVNKIGCSERTDAVIEPKLSMQWFLKMKEISRPALENVMNDSIRLIPEKFKNTYRHWMENVKDWCISRQLWWGQRIPAYYLPDGKIVVAKSPEEALKKAGDPNLTTAALKQDEDVLDTWFSSWLWPIAVFDGIRKPDNKDIQYYYPTNDLITAPEILFFWVARMIIAGYEYRGEMPFNNVYLTGLVRDSQRRKMSKQLGNSPDPLVLMKKYGADGVRVGMLLCSPAGNDLLYEDSLPEQGRNFGNKIWNAFRLVKSWQTEKSLQPSEAAQKAVEWFDNLLNKNIALIDDFYKKFRISDALMTIYRLFWEDFASCYLEIIKPPFQQPADPVTCSATWKFFDKLLHLLHPFMPFITEEIWQCIEERKPGDSIMISPMPQAGKYDEAMLNAFEKTRQAVTGIRAIRKEKEIPQKEPLRLQIKEKKYDHAFDSVLKKLGNLSEIEKTERKPDGAISFIIQTTEYFVPLADNIDIDKEKARLQQELKYNKGFLASVEKKLNNTRFVENAPEKVVNNEKKKKADAETRIKALEEQLKALEGM